MNNIENCLINLPLNYDIVPSIDDLTNAIYEATNCNIKTYINYRLNYRCRWFNYECFADHLFPISQKISKVKK